MGPRTESAAAPSVRRNRSSVAAAIPHEAATADTDHENENNTHREAVDDDDNTGDGEWGPRYYEGARDADGKPHGRGRLRLDDAGGWYEGRFVHGVREGRGTLHFPPDDDDDEDANSDGAGGGGGGGGEGGNDSADADGAGDGGERNGDEGDGESERESDSDGGDGGGGGSGDAGADKYPLGGDYVSGMFADDAIHGWAVYHGSDGARKEGTWAGPSYPSLLTSTQNRRSFEG